MRDVLYVLGRFPEIRDTFVRREMETLARRGHVRLRVRALATSRSDAVVDGIEVAQPPSAVTALRAVAFWLTRRPFRMPRDLLRLAWWQLAQRRTPRGALAIPLRAAEVARRASEDGVQHIHSHFAWPSEAAWFVHRLTGIPYSFTVHTDAAARGRSYRAIAQEARFIVSPSEQGAQALRRRLPGHGAAVHVVRAGLRVEDYPFRAEPRQPHEPRVLCVAGLDDFKGHDVLLRALTVDDRLRSVHLDLIGDGPEAERLQRLTSSLRLTGRVRFHGSQPHDVVMRFLADADLAVIASRLGRDDASDNIPVALMEAMAAGVPVVSTRTKGIPELVIDGVTGWLVAPDDPRKLAAAMACALDDRAEAFRRVLAAREHVLAHFHVETSATALERLLLADA